ILHSGDGGRHWHKQLDGLAINTLMVTAAQAEVANAEGAGAVAADDAAASLALDNAHFFLDDVTAGAQHGAARPLLDVWFRDSHNGWAAGAYGTLLRTRDGGQSWAYVPGLDNPERLHLNTVLGLADGSVMVAGEGGRLYRSLDDGEHWLATQVLTDASLYKLLALADGRVLALGFGGTLYVSADQGQHWQPLALPVAANLYGGTQLRDGTVVLAGQGGALLHAGADLHFSPRPLASKAPLLAVSQLPDGQLALVGPGGFMAIPTTPSAQVQP
ncbi:MAG: YCF48-related protein, partial [Pseudomonas sp.]